MEFSMKTKKKIWLAGIGHQKQTPGVPAMGSIAAEHQAPRVGKNEAGFQFKYRIPLGVLKFCPDTEPGDLYLRGETFGEQNKTQKT